MNWYGVMVIMVMDYRQSRGGWWAKIIIENLWWGIFPAGPYPDPGVGASIEHPNFALKILFSINSSGAYSYLFYKNS